MKEQDFRQILEDIAQEIPDTMDLWQDIQSQIDKPKRKRKPRSYMRWMAGIAAAMLVLAGAAVAAFLFTGGSSEPVAMFYNGSTGISQVGTAGLITDLNLVNHHPTADLNVTLQWAYADGNQIALGYMVDYSTSLIAPPVSRIRLFDAATGTELTPPDFIRGGGGGGGGGGDRQMYGSTAMFDARGYTDNPDRIGLKLVMEFSNVSAPAGQGGGGGGGSADDLPTPVPAQMVAPFTTEFEFSVPFIPAVHIDASQALDIADSRMVLSNIDYAPSVTLADLCFRKPDDRVWYPLNDVNSNGSGAAPFDYIHERSYGEYDCGQLVIPWRLYPENGSLQIWIAGLTSEFTFNQERLAAFTKDMRQTGFELTTYTGGDTRAPTGPNAYWYGQFGFMVTKIPADQENIYQDTINTLVTLNFVDKILAPLVFEFDMPDANP